MKTEGEQRSDTLSDRCQLLPNFKERKHILMVVEGRGGEGGIPQKQRPQQLVGFPHHFHSLPDIQHMAKPPGTGPEQALDHRTSGQMVKPAVGGATDQGIS